MFTTNITLLVKKSITNTLLPKCDKCDVIYGQPHMHKFPPNLLICLKVLAAPSQNLLFRKKNFFSHISSFLRFGHFS